MRLAERAVIAAVDFIEGMSPWAVIAVLVGCIVLTGLIDSPADYRLGW